MKTVLFIPNCKAAQFMDLEVIQVTSKITSYFCCYLNILSIGKTAKKTNSRLKQPFASSYNSKMYNYGFLAVLDKYRCFDMLERITGTTCFSTCFSANNRTDI